MTLRFNSFKVHFYDFSRPTFPLIFPWQRESWLSLSQSWNKACRLLIQTPLNVTQNVTDCDLCRHVQSEACVRAAVRLSRGGMTVAFRPHEEPGNQLQWEREQRRDVLGDRADSSLTAFHPLHPSTSHPLNKTSDLLGRLQNTTTGQRATLMFGCSSILPFCHKWGIFQHVNLMSTVSVFQEGRWDMLSIFRSVMKC